MRKVIFLLSALPLAPCAAEMPDYVSASREAVAEFSTVLKSELESAMKAGGPVNAIQVCQLKAPGIAAAVSKARGLRIARTSLKLRNPANAPDAWERAVLDRFQQQATDGADLSALEHYEVVETDGRKTFRYMKAIPTQGVCLNCHGGQIAPEVRAVLDRLYPNDQARGFKPGDLRGAFTVVRALP
ncbi:MAG: glutamate synthase [Proteobacteria bacterium]|nr:glutamate synthase [Pseudomonadota bacterium]